LEEPSVTSAQLVDGAQSRSLDECGAEQQDAAMPEFTMRTDETSCSLDIEVIVPAAVETAFALWADPRVLERWWGPPGHPCVVEEFDLRPGGRVRYVMTGPDGTRYPGWWEVLEVDAPHRLHLRDGFGDSPDAASPEMPVATTDVTFVERESDTVMRIHSRYASPEQLRFALDLGMEEGFGAALGQIDDLLR
jgi:uncharacterized protein YndB with AHSA1/START domain